ncbi:hypothetical protein AOQ84DRAFT_381647 [Glonium stellatum]|uniref:LicD/FKTN/FKRP nucleotidyltransferase domain-containing protein n=1 Tax=Glonium stellatum TaxID=574774 RepID=A0A8E2JN16_9PEZI|nr:hypothetical protein AOQ84DRAFT_381647 [Glonium stellatum]
MRILQYAAAIASASLFAHTVAAPTESVPENPSRVTKRSAAGGSVAVPAKPQDDPSKNKYFHEPGGDDILGHYDSRYFHGVVSYDERTDTLTHMIRAYLNFFREEGLDTWIAHGTLLGWWWNGKMLPWDWDVDTQVSGATLEYLGKNLNRTIHHYVSEDKKVKRDYLLDINPWMWERERGDGMNIIDARWIDIRNGLYIDITGLSETHPDVAPGVWSCKNYHRYKTSDLYPMRESIYEGVPAKIPYAYDKILTEEYQQKALVLTEYEGHLWDSAVKEWVKKPVEKKDTESEPT